MPLAPIFLLASLAQAALPPVESCAGPLSFYVDAVTTAGSKEAYMCLATREEAGELLRTTLEGLDSEDGHKSQLSRALAIHLMQRVSRPFTAEEARALIPEDRRLLIDAIQAHRGRLSPSPAHVVVLEQFDWYQPDNGFTKGRLSELDHQNITLLEKPPAPEPPPEPEPASAAMAEAKGADAPSAAETWCGCSSGGAPAGWVGLPLVVLGWGRRRRRA